MRRPTYGEVAVFIALLLALAVLCLTGCVSRTTAETGAVHGQINGQPVAIQWERDSEGRTSITVPPAVVGAAGMLPSPWGELAAGLLSLVAGGSLAAARVQSRRAEEHKADADDGWKRYLDTKAKEPKT